LESSINLYICYPDEKYAEVLESMYLPADKRINNERIIDWSKIKYNYQWEDVASAVKDKNRGANILKKKVLLFIRILLFG
jgi:hypothetical protein